MGNIVDEVIVMTEKETLDLAVHHRINGAKKHRESYIKNKQLKSPDSIESHRKNLELLFERVTVGKKKKGKDREYYLYGRRSKTLKKPKRASATVTDKDDLIISEYVFNRLLDVVESVKHGSVKYWANRLDMPFIFNHLNLEDLFEGKYSYSEFDQNPANIAQEFHMDVERRTKSYLETAFKQLDREGKIKLSTTYYEISLVTKKMKELSEDGIMQEVEKTEQVYNKITKKRFTEIEDWIHKQCELYSITKNEYTEMGIYKKKKFEDGKREAKKKIDEGLKLAFRIVLIFTGFGIKLIEKEMKKKISYSTFINSYFNKFINHSIQKYEGSNHKDSPFPQKAFYMYNTLIILDRIGIKNIDHLIKKYEPTPEAIEKTNIMRYEFAEKREREEEIKRPMAF